MMLMVLYNKTWPQTYVHLQANINVICGAQKQMTPTFEQGEDECCFYIDLICLCWYYTVEAVNSPVFT
mgnify:CR=1 FL=1